MSSLWGELERRNVVRVALAYAVVSWLILQLLTELHAMNGDKKSALESLRRAIDTDWLGYWSESPDQNPNLALIHDDPEYVAMMDELKESLAVQLDELRELQQRGKLVARPDQLSQIEFDLTL